MLWLNPQPCVGDLDKIYKGYYTHGKSRKGNIPKLYGMLHNSIISSLGGSNSFIRDWKLKQLGKFLCSLPLINEMAKMRIMYLPLAKRKRLLDIGCGNGEFLAIMHRFGWDVLGVERDAIAARIAQDLFKIPVLIVENTDKFCLKDTCFDVVTLHHVLEHNHNPIALIKECYRLLKSKGILIIVTPNIKSLAHQIFKKNWRDLDPPRHFYLFNSTNLVKCLNHYGFKIRMLKTSARWARHIYAQSKTIKRKDNKSEMMPNIIFKVEGLGFHLIEAIIKFFWNQAGEELILIATK